MNSARRQWGLLVGALGLAVACGGLELPSATEDPSPQPSDRGVWPRFAPETCLRTGADGVPTAVSCGELHDDEVFAEFSIPDPRPDDEALIATARSACIAAFPDYVGAPYDTSRYSVAWHIGEAVMTCALFAGEPLQGSAKGAAE